jgi:hypothetical protein
VGKEGEEEEKKQAKTVRKERGEANIYINNK